MSVLHAIPFDIHDNILLWSPKPITAACNIHPYITSLFMEWAQAFRDREYHAAVDTNNGVETLKKVT